MAGNELGTLHLTLIFESSAGKVLKKTICYQCYLCVKIALIAKGIFLRPCLEVFIKVV